MDSEAVSTLKILSDSDSEMGRGKQGQLLHLFLPYQHHHVGIIK